MRRATRFLTSLTVASLLTICMVGCASKAPVHLGSISDTEIDQRRLRASKHLAEDNLKYRHGDFIDVHNLYLEVQRGVDATIAPDLWWMARIMDHDLHFRQNTSNDPLGEQKSRV